MKIARYTLKKQRYIHKKQSKTDYTNFARISLLSIKKKIARLTREYPTVWILAI